MSLAVLLLQGNDPGELDDLIGQIVRFGIIALFFFGPLLKKLFEKKSASTRTQPKKRVIVRAPKSEHEYSYRPEELEEEWMPEPQPVVASQEPASDDWIDTPAALPTRLAEGDLMHASLDEHRVKLDQPGKKRVSRAREWRAALITREILGPPVGLRSQNSDRAPFG